MIRKIILSAFYLVLAIPAFSQVPPLVNLQGRLTDSSGLNKPDGTYKIKFIFWDQATSGTSLWTETHTDVPVRNGVFQVFLGQYTTSPALETIFTGVDRYLEITIDNDPAMVPRQQIVTVPFAMQARKADMLGNSVAVSSATNLGVGTSAPYEKLHVTGGKTILVGSISNGTGSGDEPNRATLRVIGNNGPGTSGSRVIQIEAPWTSATATGKYFMAGFDGTPAVRFYIDGSGGWWSSSSRALKSNITAIPNAMNLVSQMEPVSYNWGNDTSGHKSMGFIAEDLAAVFPEAVLENELVNYDYIIPVLTKAIKELREQNQALESRIQALENQ